MPEIIQYDNKYQPDFKRLNLAWLDANDLTEKHDLEILDDPQGTVIDRGGCIFLAMAGGKVIGTAGLSKEAEGVYELVKMTVDNDWRGRGIAIKLMEHCLEAARASGAKRIFLFSSSKLEHALKLYEKFGFQHIPATGSPFITADIKMELNLKPPKL